MFPYFEKNSNWEILRKAMDSWLKTPYRHFAACRGRGVDCTLLIAALFHEIGILDKVDYEYYPRDWQLTTTEERVLEGIYNHFEKYTDSDKFSYQMFTKLPQDYFLRGDIITFNYPHKNIIVTHHAGIWVGEDNGRRNLFFNSIENTGVTFLQYGTHWRNRLTTVFRLMDKGDK